MGFLRGLFGKSNVAVEESEPIETESDFTQNFSAAHPAAVPGPHRAAVNGISIPLASIVVGLPLELQGRVRTMDFGQIVVTVPLDVVLGQLGQGTVKVPFGMIRRAAPAAFASGPESDQIMIALPLGEILPRVNPALLTRRPTQRQVDVADEVVSPFDGPGQGLIFAVGNSMAESSVVTPFRATPPTPPRRAVTPSPAPPSPTAHVPPAPRIAMPIAVPQAPTPPTPAAPPIQLATPFVARIVSPAPVAKAPAPAPTPAAPTSVAPAPTTPPPAAALSVMLTSLAENWPDVIRHEIVRLNLLDARVALPVDLVESSLKRGRVAYPWKTLRTWIRPAALTATSPHDTVELELPLKVVAPLFIGRKSGEASKNVKVEIDEAIPNLFFGFPKPEAQNSLTAGKTPDTNYYVFDDASDTALVDESTLKRKGPSGTEFIAKYATPNEIVSRAAAIDGVAGALIALPDGLMVASRIPAELNGDTLAAFLPQIFAKISTSTKELRMGELNNLSFTIGNVPWKIFRVNAVFFAAFGRAGENMNSAGLAALAGELDRKNK